jgi:hypothetical protein
MGLDLLALVEPPRNGKKRSGWIKGSDFHLAQANPLLQATVHE